MGNQHFAAPAEAEPNALARQGCAFLAVAMLAVGAHAIDGAARVPEIAEVTSLEALRALEPIRLENGWAVRLGLSDGGAEAGPWKLLYCQADWVGDGEPEARHERDILGAPLGPVFVRVGPRATTLGRMVMDPTAPRQGLYCGTVLTAWEGRYQVRVLSAEGKVIAQRDLEVTEPKACGWTQFAARREHLGAEGETPWLVSRKVYAACPRYPAETSLWPPADRQVELLQSRDGTPLPGRIPLGEPWDGFLGLRHLRARKLGEAIYPLKLSLEGDAFVVRAEVKLRTWADLFLLARWWVNGKPVVPPRTDEVGSTQLGRLITYGQEMKVAFGLPEHLGKLRVGDKVGLQVLYSPAMIEQLPKSRAPDHLRMLLADLRKPGLALVPLLSNRLDFALTESLLRLAAADAQEE